MIPGVANLGTWVRGDTIRAKRLTITQTLDSVTTPVDFTGVGITLTLQNHNNKVQKTIGAGVTLTDAVNGIFHIDKFALEKKGEWVYDLQIVFPNGDVKTYLVGAVTIVNDVTK
jgi:hypothetical protein